MKYILIAIILMGATQSFAYSPLVICGGAPGSASFELDTEGADRGGILSQIVLRNPDIINDFISKQAIYRGELNSKGEFVLFGRPHNFNLDSRLNNSMDGSINNRYIRFIPLSNTSYKFVISYTDSNYKNIELANFVFNDCQTNY